MKLRNLFSILLSALAITSALAVPASREWINYTQPDGSLVRVQICGDEYGHWYQTQAGLTMQRDAQGFLRQTDVTQMQNERLARIREAKQQNARSRAAQVGGGQYVPQRGHVHIPVILVNYTDVQFSMDKPADCFDRLFNTDGGTNPRATGSVHDYYMASSDSILSLEYDVYGPYTVSNNRAYYGKDHDNGGIDANIRKLIIEAVQLAYADGMDVSKYDNDFDGKIDNVSVITAGYNQAEGGPADAIWPHYSALYNSPMVGSKYIGGYLVISEYRGYTGKVQAGIGTYCHEFGHALGLPDLYDTESSSTYTVGSWDIMCSGSYNNNGSTPPTFTAFERFIMGWLEPEQLKRPGNYIMEPIETSNRAYLIADGNFNGRALYPSPDEYFLIENRQKVGWDANTGALAGTGLMISHITFDLTKFEYNTFNNNRPLGFAIVSAANTVQTQTTPSDLFPGSANITSWIPKCNNGVELTEQKLLNIMAFEDATVSFHFGESSDEGFHFEPSTCPTLVTTFDGERKDYDTARVVVSGKMISSRTLDIYFSTTGFMFSPDNGQTWVLNQDHFTDQVAADGTYSRELLVCYRPTRQNCKATSANLVVMSEDKLDIAQMMLFGQAPRPVYITIPVPKEVSALSSTSFTAAWEDIEDAEGYYVTMYERIETPSEQVQDFEDFKTADGIVMAEWESNFVRTFTQSKYDGKVSVQFLETGEYITSEKYPCVPTQISFWLSNNYSQYDDKVPGGQFLVEGSVDGDTWQTIEKIAMKRTTKNLIMDYSFDPTTPYVQFRFSYTHEGGHGGVLLDCFTASLPATINYFCQGTERETTSAVAIFSGLQAGHHYYWQVRAFEAKGCEEHFTALSEPQHVITPSDAQNESEIDVKRDPDGGYTLLLTQPADAAADLCIYTAAGQLLSQTRIPDGQTTLTIPTEGMQPNTVYFLKVVSGRMQRKAAFGKMLYY
ncbi:MAG: M6 family metalloprotease domain-containing protein [Paludibacteraceae bacterium]|nr:M6 family metalloprotease domain-containing protein [Paludibacteraceae bacterium]